MAAAAERMDGRLQERRPARCGGLRICGNPIGDVSHASNFRSALRCYLPKFQYTALCSGVISQRSPVEVGLFKRLSERVGPQMDHTINRGVEWRFLIAYRTREIPKRKTSADVGKLGRRLLGVKTNGLNDADLAHSPPSHEEALFILYMSPLRRQYFRHRKLRKTVARIRQPSESPDAQTYRKVLALSVGRADHPLLIRASHD